MPTLSAKGRKKPKDVKTGGRDRMGWGLKKTKVLSPSDFCHSKEVKWPVLLRKMKKKSTKRTHS